MLNATSHGIKSRLVLMNVIQFKVLIGQNKVQNLHNAQAGPGKVIPKTSKIDISKFIEIW